MSDVIENSCSYGKCSILPQSGLQSKHHNVWNNATWTCDSAIYDYWCHRRWIYEEKMMNMVFQSLTHCSCYYCVQWWLWCRCWSASALIKKEEKYTVEEVRQTYLVKPRHWRCDEHAQCNRIVQCSFFPSFLSIPIIISVWILFAYHNNTFNNSLSVRIY